MNTSFKPSGYTSASPYFIVEDAHRFIELMKQIFDARELRTYHRPSGKIMHAEVQIDDSVIMLADATENYPAETIVMHVYVPDTDTVFQKAIAAGCEAIDSPKSQEGDPDRRGTFKDFAGNLWSVGTQMSDSEL